MSSNSKHKSPRNFIWLHSEPLCESLMPNNRLTPLSQIGRGTRRQSNFPILLRSLDYFRYTNVSSISQSRDWIMNLPIFLFLSRSFKHTYIYSIQERREKRKERNWLKRINIHVIYIRKLTRARETKLKTQDSCARPENSNSVPRGSPRGVAQVDNGVTETKYISTAYLCGSRFIERSILQSWPVNKIIYSILSRVCVHTLVSAIW